MQIFNKGQRLFKHGALRILPGRMTEIPSEFETVAKGLLNDYPSELVNHDTKELDAAKETMASKDKEIADLKDQVTKLQQLLSAQIASDSEATAKTEEPAAATPPHAPAPAHAHSSKKR